MVLTSKQTDRAVEWNRSLEVNPYMDRFLTKVLRATSGQRMVFSINGALDIHMLQNETLSLLLTSIKNQLKMG
jgi:hypothetical protein